MTLLLWRFMKWKSCFLFMLYDWEQQQRKSQCTKNQLLSFLVTVTAGVKFHVHRVVYHFSKESKHSWFAPFIKWLQIRTVSISSINTSMLLLRHCVSWLCSSCQGLTQHTLNKTLHEVVSGLYCCSGTHNGRSTCSSVHVLIEDGGGNLTLPAALCLHHKLR